MNATMNSLNEDLLFHPHLQEGAYSSKMIRNTRTLTAEDTTYHGAASSSPVLSGIADCSANAAENSERKISDEGIKQWNKFDVLWGRSGDTRTHQGNVFFRTLVNQYRELYMNSPRKLRTLISEKIVRTVRAKGGRFLKQDPDSLLWFETGDSKAFEKTSQALRQRKMLEKMLLNRARERQEEETASVVVHHHQQESFNKMPSLLLNTAITTPQLQGNELLLPSTNRTLSPTQTFSQHPSALAQLLAMKAGAASGGLVTANPASVADVLRNPLVFPMQANGGRFAPGLLPPGGGASPTNFQNPLIFN
eukprot:CAMPEP_0194049500 /NCGR_PEP_ID=MMETSP0009_2-20130614/30716_1 /TAXON_ID=210454 /ORGANISM="Grammatophora oceanica, Strain CCMP 410" /LENGTH=306 /DNA_ID=CAMNT_0038695675 /DNA_START=25 /DNA_END=945 /DNA_ORIENTATION=+